MQRRRMKRGAKKKALRSQRIQKSFGSSFPRDVEVHNLELAGTVIVLTTSAGGTFGVSTAMTRNILTTGSGAIVTNFQLYRINRISVDVIPLTTSAGVTKFYWSEDTTSVSSSAAQDAKAVTLTNTNVNPRSKKTFTWRARTLEDQNFQDQQASTYVWAYFKAYTESTYGSPNSTALWQLNIRCDVSLKSLY